MIIENIMGQNSEVLQLNMLDNDVLEQGTYVLPTMTVTYNLGSSPIYTIFSLSLYLSFSLSIIYFNINKPFEISLP